MIAPEAVGPTALELQDPDLLRSQAFIDGVWEGEARTPVHNPADGALVGRVCDIGEDGTRRAVVAAHRAFADWRLWTAAERAAVLWRWHAAVLETREDLARILTAEQGKPLEEALGEVAYAASYIAWYAEEARRLYGEVIPSPRRDSRIVVLSQPVGVVAAITPWNFPAAMVTRKLAPALAAGCTVVLKPAPQTPLTALALVRLLERAGAPAGVINVVTGEAAPIGEVLTSHPAVRKLSFTGSTAVGKRLTAAVASTMKRVSMELGGNAPFIVFDDADLDAAVAGLMASKFRNAGQTCVCVNRIYVQAGVAPAFEARLASAIDALVVGPGDVPGVQQGPLIDEAAVVKVQRHVDDAVARGGRLVRGGARHALGGTFYAPTLIADCAPEMALATEETFGPLAALFTFADEPEAIALANASEAGLAGYFYTRDHGRAWRMAEALEVGMVGVNTGLISTEVAPFGGVKESGAGREGSRHGLHDYVDLKYVCFAGL
jgi:succinate-semialdehyde dehydrogenase/glutarate-semialdehyde dehydrogenase